MIYGKLSNVTKDQPRPQATPSFLMLYESVEKQGVARGRASPSSQVTGENHYNIYIAQEAFNATPAMSKWPCFFPKNVTQVGHTFQLQIRFPVAVCYQLHTQLSIYVQFMDLGGRGCTYKTQVTVTVTQMVRLSGSGLTQHTFKLCQTAI